VTSPHKTLGFIYEFLQFIPRRELELRLNIGSDIFLVIDNSRLLIGKAFLLLLLEGCFGSLPLSRSEGTTVCDTCEGTGALWL
jgi:hypothetical protein